MEAQFINLIRLAAAALVGGVIGLAFGAIQEAALRRHQKLQQTGEFKSGWAIMPGSFRRIAYLLVALALVQLLCPVIFAPDSFGPWCVSGGLVLGYGWTLFQQMRRRRA